MSLLFKHLRIHQVFGANTDVGKTILTSALARASATKGNQVYYLKPVSTGPIEDADDEHIKRFAGGRADKISSKCLFRFDDPVSPHLAARYLSEKRGVEVPVPTDDTFVTAVAAHIRNCASQNVLTAHMYVETAGGVHSPTLSGTTQLDAYRPLLLPVVLIGDSKLGGISSTISAYESLLLRGYTVDALLLFRDTYYRNYEYLQPYFAERGIHISSLDPPPARLEDVQENLDVTEKYYQEIAPSSTEGGVFEILDHLDDCHARRIAELESMPRRSLDTLWWPFVQHGLVKTEKDVNVIDSAWGDYFTVSTHGSDSSASAASTPSLLQPEFDGSASWWTQALGHAHPALTLAAARAAGRYGHVMFPSATHRPALQLAERLVAGPGAGWATRAFFSDDGSTGMEVALKMALRAFAVRNADRLGADGRKRLGILGLKGSYHGDTIGAMDACEEGVYTCEWHDAKGVWLDPPTVGISNGKVQITLPPAISPYADTSIDGGTLVDVGSLAAAYDVERRLADPLAKVYRKYIEQTLRKYGETGEYVLAALVLEPLVMGAGGMIFVDPLFQRVLVDVVRSREKSASGEWSDLPVIFDEVFVGLYRLGMLSTSPVLGVTPDISVNAKILTGGLMPLAVTLATESIFRAFLSEQKADALLHGHSYTAYPAACEVANETLAIVEKLATSDTWAGARADWRGEENSNNEPTVWSLWDSKLVYEISRLTSVQEVMAMGTVLVVKFKDEASGYLSHSAQKRLGMLKAAVGTEQLSAAPGGGPFSIHYRTLGSVAYFMTSLNTPNATIRAVEDRIWEALQERS